MQEKEVYILIGINSVDLQIKESPIFFEPKSIYFKHGIYQSFISVYTSFKGGTPTQIVYYDEVRRGNSIEKVDFNINPNLQFYENIHACGLEGYKNTSLKELGININYEEFDSSFKKIFIKNLSKI